jgi:hypothetical protein
MRDGSPNHLFPAGSLAGFRPSAKSLFWNILAVSPCGSRFCQDRFRSKLPNPFGINILGSLTEKMWFDQPHAKSLFWKILPVSSCGSRFCADSTRSEANKSLRMNILEKPIEKNRRHRSATLPCPIAPRRLEDQRRGRQVHMSSRQARPTAIQGATRKPLDAA